VGRPEQPLQRPGVRSFASWVEQLAGNPRPLPEARTCYAPKAKLCQLCWGSTLRYPDEQALKREALRRWTAQVPGLPLPEFVPSPSGRFYRVVSKRRWLPDRRQLVMVEDVEWGRLKALAITHCLVELPAHAAVYAHLQKLILNSSIGTLLNYAILKGTAQEFILILNVTDMQRDRAAMNKLSKSLTAAHPALKGIWLARGRPGDEYYLNIPAGDWQKLYGASELTTDQNLQFSPQCFTQINPWSVPELLRRTEQWLGDPSLPLLDLYCGYGLFSLALPRTGHCWGLENSPESVNWARRNARRLKRPATRFDIWDLATQPLPEKRRPQGEWVAVIDPPRAGMTAELTEQIASWGPARVVQWICDVDQAATQLAQWGAAGYTAREAVALDMFSGTNALELGVLLLPGSGAAKAKTGRQL
jgi:tRNA/tmRNA/rRNA uracil-C5-methylase (TrmA/RlmC/RlmD family)